MSDAPALREADLGLAAGAPAASPGPADLVTSRDGLAGVLAAVGEGRSVAAGLRAAVGHLAVCSFAGAALLLGAAAAGLPAALTPVQILWSNFVVAALAATALGAAGPGGEAAPVPRGRPGERFGAPDGLAALALEGGAVALAALAAFLLARGGGSPGLAQTHAFAVLGGALLLRAAVRLASGRAAAAGFAGGRLAPAAGALALLLLLAAIAAPGAGEVFGTVPLAGGDWLRVLGLSLAPLPAAALLGRRGRARS